MSLETLLLHAVRVVEKAGKVAKCGFGNSPIVQEKLFSDIVTEADKDVERCVIDNIQRLYPHHGFLSEEAGKRAEGAEYVWILDPIDGTKYYARGVPLYSISLALQKNGSSILGVVFDPETEQMFCGTVGEGAVLKRNEEQTPIHCSRETQLQRATLCVEIPSRDLPLERRRWALGKMAVLVDSVCRVRMLGVSALGLCYCAMNGFDVYVNLGSTTECWDVAAGKAVLMAAGGEFHQLGRTIVAGPPELCRQILDLLGLKDQP